MSRVVNPDGVGKQRDRLIKGVALALRQLATRSTVDNETRDLVAFMALALNEIASDAYWYQGTPAANGACLFTLQDRQSIQFKCESGHLMTANRELAVELFGRINH